MRLWSREEGSSLIEAALLMPMLLLVLVGMVDFGQAYYAEIVVSAAAQAGTAYGVLNPTDTAGMQSAALLDASDLPAMTAVATYGCECSDGSGESAACTVTPSCLVNMVNYIDVSTSVNYRPMLAYPLIPATMVLKGHSRMRVAP